MNPFSMIQRGPETAPAAPGASQNPFSMIQRPVEEKPEPPLMDAINPVGEDDVPYKITPEFRLEATKVAQRLGTEPAHLLAAMHFETGGSFDPAQKNKAGSGATGLIQFMPGTLKSLGTTAEKAAKMSQTEQLELVEKYFQPYKGKLKTLEDVYMAILWPKAVGKPNSYVLFSNDNPASKLYAQNRGLDFNKDGNITKAEASTKVRRAAMAAGENPEPEEFEGPDGKVYDANGNLISG